MKLLKSDLCKQLETFLYRWLLCLEFISRAAPTTANFSLLAEYSEIFNHLDPSSTGSLSRDELVIALRLAGHNPTRDEIDQLLAHKQGKAVPFVLFGLFLKEIYLCILQLK